MRWHFHSASLRYALALWLATVLALFISFVVQLEPAQWSAITVWIVFIQNPRMNYSKILWWSFGTITGAAVAITLTACFSQTPELFILFLALWLAVCAGWAPFVNNYKAYGAVLAGYTCAIISMSAVEHPDAIFRLAVTRVSCIFIGMASAILMINLLWPKRRHWRETVHHLGEHLKATMLHAAGALTARSAQPAQFTWRHMVDRLSTLEHTLDLTTAESADSRVHAPQVRSLVATLFDLLAQAQAVEIHLARPNLPEPVPEIKELLQRTNSLLTAFAANNSALVQHPLPDQMKEITGLQNEISLARQKLSGPLTAEQVSRRFLLDRLAEILEEFSNASADWAGLFGPWRARRASHLSVHRDYRSAFIYGTRMFLAITLAGVLWFLTQWPSGAQFILFIAIVCSLLSLVDHAPQLGFPFLKSALFCAFMAYVETFWLLQKSEGFLVLAFMLGLFLLPAAYAYRHPRLIGGAVVSMLIFYGLSNPANRMNYDIAAFLNNGLALLAATGCGFFAFHAVPSLNADQRRYWLLRAVRADLARDLHENGVLADQAWTSRMFDRLRLLHRAAGSQSGMTGWRDAENEMLLGLQLGLRQQRLRDCLRSQKLAPENIRAVAGFLEQIREIARHPNIVALYLRSACTHFQETQAQAGETGAGALAEMWEITILLETSAHFYAEG